VILITDGDNNAGSISPLEAAKMAKGLGIRVFTVLVGRGGKVPYPMVNPITGQEEEGEADFPTNPELLKQISALTDGSSYLATDSESLRRSLKDILDSLEKTRLFEAGTQSKPEELSPWLLGPAVALALLDMLLRATRLRRFP
jgi:Ca-activated chloride channel family protein